VNLNFVKKMSIKLMALINAGYAPAPHQVVAEEEAREWEQPVLDMPHEYSEHTRVFDVEIHAGPLYRPLGMKFVVVANTFEEASTAAVDRANAMLRLWLNEDSYDRKAFLGDELPVLMNFTAEHVTKVDVVRSNVTIFRSPESHKTA
jgi:hypothetical protein